jgi:hypothetical protein
MGIEFIISNNTIVLGQRKEQSRAPARPRGPARRGGPGQRAALRGPRTAAQSQPGRRGRGPQPGRRSRGTARRGRARGGGGAALRFDVFLVPPAAAIPRGRPRRLSVYSAPSRAPAARRFPALGAEGGPEPQAPRTGRSAALSALPAEVAASTAQAPACTSTPATAGHRVPHPDADVRARALCTAPRTRPGPASGLHGHPAGSSTSSPSFSAFLSARKSARRLAQACVVTCLDLGARVCVCV